MARRTKLDRPSRPSRGNPLDHPDPDPLVFSLLNPAIEAVIGETGQAPTHRSEMAVFNYSPCLAQGLGQRSRATNGVEPRVGPWEDRESNPCHRPRPATARTVLRPALALVWDQINSMVQEVSPSSTKRVDHVQPVVANPLVGVRLLGLGPGIHDAITHEVREWTHGLVSNDRADEIAVVAVKYNFIADLGKIAGLDEAASGRHRGVVGLVVDGSRGRHERADPFPDRKRDDGVGVKPGRVWRIANRAWPRCRA